MKLVLDQIFADTVEFVVPVEVARRCLFATKSIGEAFTQACAYVGLELIEFDSVRFLTLPHGEVTTVTGHSRLWRERIARMPDAA